MTDHELSRKIAAYHDDELPPDQRRIVERLLQQDAPAAAELAELQRVRALLHSVATPSLPGEFLQQLHERVDDLAVAPIVRITGWLTAAAAAMLLACSTVLLLERADAAHDPVDPAVEWAMQSGAAAEGTPESRITQWIVSTLE